MEAAAATLAPAAGPASAPPRRTSPRRNPLSPRRTTKEARFKRISPKPSNLAARDTSVSSKAPHRPTRAAALSPKPLVPVTERRQNGDRTSPRARKDADADRWELVPDGASAGREGRQFTVANVGNNGRIYLRYVCCCCLRPAPTQARPPPNPLAGLVSLVHSSPATPDTWRSGLWGLALITGI